MLGFNLAASWTYNDAALRRAAGRENAWLAHFDTLGAGRLYTLLKPAETCVAI